MKSIGTTLLGLWLLLSHPPRALRDDRRGLTQSTEMAILVAGVVIIAAAIVLAITSYVSNRMPGS